MNDKVQPGFKRWPMKIARGPSNEPARQLPNHREVIMASAFQEPALEAITLVQLPSGIRAKRRFLQRLQQTLEPTGALSSLTPGPSANVYVIPHAAEQAVRQHLGKRSNAQWEQLLKSWGALAVNSLLLDAYIALEIRGSMVYQGKQISPPQISAPTHPRQKSAASTTAVQPAFAGPYDWHIDDRGVNAALAWSMFINKGADQNLPWENVKVAHLDTGYTEHAALGWDQGSSSFVHPDQGKDFWTGDEALDGPRDPFLAGSPGHGTRISATISGFDPSADGGPFYGVAPGAQIIPFRVTDSVIVDHVQANLIDAIHAAIDSKCHVVNISLGALRPSKSLAAAMDKAYDAGLIVVCAAGQVWGEVIYPGRFNRCITVGGVGPKLKPWLSAATGIYVDLCGPADEIRCVEAADLAPGKTGMGMASEATHGTSYATACCSGAAALWLAWHGLDALKKSYGPTGLWQIPKAFKHLAMTTARKGDWPNSANDKYGSGVLDIPALLAASLPVAGTMRKENTAYGLFDDGSL